MAERRQRCPRARLPQSGDSLVQGFGILAVMAGFAALAGILLLELWPTKFRSRKTSWRNVVCWAADDAPATSLVASGALLLSFLPCARAFSEYRTSTVGLSSQEVPRGSVMGVHVSEWLRG